MDEFPFEIPESWVWVRLEDIFNLQAGKYISASEIYEKNDGSLYPCYGGNGLRGYVKNYNREGYYPLIGRQGALCGNINYARNKFYATEHAVVVEPYFHIDISWAVYFLIQLNLNQYSTATAQPGLAVNKINKVLIPLPPLNEQKRIVAKLEEILPFIEEYDKKEQKLTTLNQQFPEQLKKSILQAAIQGKLVEQDPNDEPTSELIKRIQTEKERLISEKKIKKPKVKSEIVLRDNLPYEIVDGVDRCIADEVPFEIPESWAWVRLGNITNILMGSSPTGESLNGYGNGIEFHQGKSFFTEKFIGYSNKYTTSEITLSNDKDLLLSVRAPVGDININNRLLCIGRGISAITPLDKMETIFLFYWLMSFKLDFIKKSTGSTFKAISSDSINNQLIPIPPLNEQKHIVQKIEKLFSYIEYLK